MWLNFANRSKIRCEPYKFLFSMYNFFLKHEIKIATKNPLYGSNHNYYLPVGSSYVKGSRAQHCGRGTLKQI